MEDVGLVAGVAPTLEACDQRRIKHDNDPSIHSYTSPQHLSTLTIDLGCLAHFHGIGISGTLPRHIAWLEFTVHFGLNQLLARAIYIYPFGSSGDLVPRLEASGSQSCQGRAGARSSWAAFCGL